MFQYFYVCGEIATSNQISTYHTNVAEARRKKNYFFYDGILCVLPTAGCMNDSTISLLLLVIIVSFNFDCYQTKIKISYFAFSFSFFSSNSCCAHQKMTVNVNAQYLSETKKGRYFVCMHAYSNVLGK